MRGGGWDEYDETVEYANPSLMDRIGRSGRFTIQIKGDLLTDIGIDNRWREVWKRLKPDAASAHSPLTSELTGAWVLVSEHRRPGEGLKFCVDGHWCDTHADPKNGVVVLDDGGTYAFKGDTYSETVDYANPETLRLIGHTFNFDIKLEGDTLTLTGIGNPWHQVWKRAD